MNNNTANIDKKRFAERFQGLFNESGCKSVEIEKTLNVGRATVSRWRNGHTLPNNSQIKELADFFNVRYEWLIGKDEYKKIRDITLPVALKKHNRYENYLKSLGYGIELDDPIYECDEKGVEYITGATWKLKRDSMERIISDEEYDKLKQEIEDFIDFKILQVLNK